MTSLSQQQLLDTESKLPASMQFPDMCVDRSVLMSSITAQQEPGNEHQLTQSYSSPASAAAHHLHKPQTFEYGTGESRVTFHAPNLVSYVSGMSPVVRPVCCC